MEMKIDKRKQYKMVLDTETCPIDKDIEEVLASNMWTYDIGWAIVDSKGTVYKTESFINADIFLDEKTLMKSAYYSNKIPMYWEDIKSGKRVLTSWNKIKKVFREDIKTFGIKEVYAHNMRFDYGTLNATERWLTKSKRRYFFPYDIKVCDTLKMARDVIAPMPTYKKFCEENGFMTNHKTPRVRTSAEVLYRFITKDVDFVESHTALEDVLIEKEILAYCYRQHKKMRKYLFEN